MAGVEWDANGENLHRGKEGRTIESKKYRQNLLDVVCGDRDAEDSWQAGRDSGMGIETMQAPSKRQTVQSRTPVFCSFDMG